MLKITILCLLLTACAATPHERQREAEQAGDIMLGVVGSLGWLLW